MIFQKHNNSEITKTRLQKMKGVTAAQICEEVQQMLERIYHLNAEDYELQIVLKQKERRS